MFYNYVFQNNNSLGETHSMDVNDWKVFHLMLTGLKEGSEYNISVAGFTSVGIGVKSDVINIPTTLAC